jgi:hypothetical protein
MVVIAALLLTAIVTSIIAVAPVLSSVLLAVLVFLGSQLEELDQTMTLRRHP